MKTIVALVVAALALSGCATIRRAPAVASPVAVKAIAASHEAKDTAIIAEAAKIDAIAPAAREHTDAQRAAVASAPAADLKPAFAVLESRIQELTKANETQAKQIAALKDVELRTQAKSLRWFGLAAFALAAVLAYIRRVEFAALAALAGLLSLGLAQLISQPWFMPAVTIAVALGVAGGAWAVIHAYRKGDLAAKTERESARLRGTLETLVPAVDAALESLDTAGKETVRAALSRLMDSEHKSLIHEVRATLAK